MFDGIISAILIVKCSIENISTVNIKHSMLVQCWATISDTGLALKHYILDKYNFNQILGVLKSSELSVVYYKGPLLSIDFCDSIKAITHASPNMYINMKNMDLIQINYPDRL